MKRELKNRSKSSWDSSNSDNYIGVGIYFFLPCATAAAVKTASVFVATSGEEIRKSSSQNKRSF